MAERVYWNATGKVSEVVGAGFAGLGVAVDDEVELEFSYDDGAGGTGVEGFPNFHEGIDYRENIDLEVDVVIGGQAWSGSIASSTGGLPRTFEVTDVINSLLGGIEKVAPNASSKHGAAFSSFPGASGSGVNELSAKFVDAVSPFHFLFTTDIPTGAFVTLCEITSASGQIKAGAEQINYVIDLSSIRVGDGTPPVASEPFTVEIARVGLEIELSWEATSEKCYRIQRSSDLKVWTEIAAIYAFSSFQSYLFAPIGDPSAEYYRIVESQ